MRIKDAIIKHNMLFRLIVTIVLVVCVPLLATGWFLVDRARANLERQNNELQLLNTSNFLSYFNAQMTDMIGTAVRIGYEQKVTPESIEGQPYNEIEAIRLLSYYKFATPIASKLFVYFKHKVYIIGSGEKYDKDIFIASYANSNPDTARKITDMLDQASGRQVAYVSNLDIARNDSKFPGMFVCVRITVETPNDAVVVFYLNNNSLNTSFLGAMNSRYYELYIFDADGNLMLSNKADLNEAIERKDFKAFVSDRAADSSHLKAGGQSYGIFKRFDAKTGLSFVMMAPQSDIDLPLKSFYRLLQYTIIAVILVSAVMAASAVYLNYRPILELVRRVRASDGERAAAGEIKTIGRELDRRNQEKELLMDKLAEQKLKLADYLLRNLLDGVAVDRGEMEETGIGLSGPYYCVIAVSGIAPKNGEQEKIAAGIFEECGSHACIVQPIYEKYLILICDLPQCEEAVRGRLADTIARQLGGMEKGEALRLGVGSCEENLGGIRSSYLAALISMDQGGNDKIAYYEKAVDSFSSFDIYPSDEVLRFMQHTKQGEKESAMAEFDKAVGYISQNLSSHILEQYVCLDIVNIFIKSVSKMGLALSEQDIGRLMYLNSGESLRREMAPLIARVCDEAAMRKASSARQLSEEIKRYIDENYSDPGLNLLMVADHFKMSIYAVSGIVNERIGMGFREYIVTRRIEESKKLLLDADRDRSIKEIAAIVGFYDVSYFIKSFRRICGTTPNRFKKKD
jgi:two-component system response regulator YesN